MEKLIQQNILESFQVKVYGESISNHPLIIKTLESRVSSSNFTLVNVYGLQIQSTCIQFPEPTLLMVPGDGVAPVGCGFDDQEGIKMWVIERTTPLAQININSGVIEELLPDEILRAIDAGIKIKNVKYKNGKLRGKIEVWVKVGAKVSRTLNFSINTGIGGWVTIKKFDLGVADVKVQVKLKSLKQVCARIKACADFPWPIGKQCAKASSCIKL